MMASESDGLLGNAPAPERKYDRHLTSVAVLVLAVVVGAIGGVFSALAWKSSPIAADLVPNVDVARSKYTATQFISFTINTLGGLAAHGECEGRQVDASGMCYLGDSKNITEDVEHRLRLVEEVLDRLKDDDDLKHPRIDHRKNVLKIFMLPEFFWRGPNGAYRAEDIFEGGILYRVFDRVSELISDDYFKDFLFVFGTVIAVRLPEDPIKSDEHVLDPNQLQYYNFAPVLKGGSGNQPRYVVTKKYISQVDFLNRNRLPNPAAGVDEREYNKAGERAIEFFARRKDKLVEDNFIEMDGLRIGLEICLDHRMGALWSNLEANHNSKLVDVHLITSAGMAIERGPVPLVTDGVVYLTDGGASSAACIRSDNGRFDPKRVCRDKGVGLKHLPMGSTGYSDFSPLATCVDVAKSDLLFGYYSLYQKQGCANTLRKYGVEVMKKFVHYPPSIELYPTVALPGHASK